MTDDPESLVTPIKEEVQNMRKKTILSGFSVLVLLLSLALAGCGERAGEATLVEFTLEEDGDFVQSEKTSVDTKEKESVEMEEGSLETETDKVETDSVEYDEDVATSEKSDVEISGNIESEEGTATLKEPVTVTSTCSCMRKVVETCEPSATSAMNIYTVTNHTGVFINEDSCECEVIEKTYKCERCDRAGEKCLELARD